MARQYSLTAALLGAGIVQVERAKTMLTALMQAHQFVLTQSYGTEKNYTLNFQAA